MLPTHGTEGRADKPASPVHGPHPNELPEASKKKIIEVSSKHPAFGQQRLSDQLHLEGLNVSPTSVCNIWIKKDMETKYKRFLSLEEKAATQAGFVLTEDQIRLSGKANTCFKRMFPFVVEGVCLVKVLIKKLFPSRVQFLFSVYLRFRLRQGLWQADFQGF